MMKRTDHDPDLSRLEAYLDGLLSDKERAAFEAELARRKEWLAEVDRQNTVNVSLKRLYRAPSEHVMSASRTTGKERRVPVCKPRRTGATVLLAAACVGLVVMAGWQVRSFYTRPARNDPYARQTWRDFAAVYQAEAVGDFQPTWVCEDDITFSKFVEDRFGQPAVLAALPPHTIALGWSYANTISEQSAYILAKVGDARVLVFVDRVDRDRDRSPTRCSGVHVYRRELGALVLYEVSALDEPHILDKFRIP